MHEGKAMFAQNDTKTNIYCLKFPLFPLLTSMVYAGAKEMTEKGNISADRSLVHGQPFLRMLHMRGDAHPWHTEETTLDTPIHRPA